MGIKRRPLSTFLANAACAAGATCVAAATFAGCASGEPDAAAFTVRDSAGITIVENAAPAWTAEDALHFPAQPALQLGTVDGEGPERFESIRSVLRLTDGRILVADGGAGELRFFDATGAHLRTVGGAGSGPGEFDWLGTPQLLAGDSILIGDSNLRRFTLFDAEGAFVRTVDAGDHARASSYRVADGRHMNWVLLRAGPPADGYRRDSVGVVLFHPEEPAMDTVARLPGNDEWQTTTEYGGRFVSSTGPLPFGRRQQPVAAGDAILHGDGATFEVTERGLDGAVRRIVRRAGTRRPVDGALRERYLEARVAAAREDRRTAIRAAVADMQFGDSVPAFVAILPVRSGGMWVQHYPLPGDSTATYSVFDGDGRWLGDIETSPHFRVTDLSGDTVLGTWTDDYDVPHVRVYHLRPGSGPPTHQP